MFVCLYICMFVCLTGYKLLLPPKLLGQLSWLNSLHGYPNAIYENLGTSVHADLMV